MGVYQSKALIFVHRAFFLQPPDVAGSAAKLWNQNTAPQICTTTRRLFWRNINPAKLFCKASWTPNVHQSQKSTCVTPLSLHASPTICPCLYLADLSVNKQVYISCLLTLSLQSYRQKKMPFLTVKSVLGCHDAKWAFLLLKKLFFTEYRRYAKPTIVWIDLSQLYHPLSRTSGDI